MRTSEQRNDKVVRMSQGASKNRVGEVTAMAWEIGAGDKTLDQGGKTGLERTGKM